MPFLRPWNNGTWLVAAIMALGTLAASLTIWVYSHHVYSTHEAQVISRRGEIVALYPHRFFKKILPHQSAKITFEQEDFLFPSKAEVTAVKQTTLGKKSILLVQLKLLPQEGESGVDGKEEDFLPGTRCRVTIDTTIPEKMTK